ncbi:MAG: hypothetical protein ACR2JY_14505 [Chloroflexota bacterium]
MAAYGLVLPVLPGKEEQARGLAEELRGPRRGAHEASRRRLGLTSEQAWLQRTPQGTMLIVYLELEADDIERMLVDSAASDDPFDRWWRQQLQDFTGLVMTPPSPGETNEHIFDWHRQ